MTENDYYDQSKSYGETNSLSEIARSYVRALPLVRVSMMSRAETTSLGLQTARLWIIMPQDWTWWVWLVTACLLLIGLTGMPEAFLAALLLSIDSTSST